MNTTAIINIARQQLGMDEEAYRALLVRVAGSSSLRQMTGRQHLDVIEELKRLGFQVATKSQSKDFRTSSKAYVRLIHALWRSCHSLGAIEDGSRSALRTFVRGQIVGADPKIAIDPDHLTYDQASPVIEALKKMERRGKEKSNV